MPSSSFIHVDLHVDHTSSTDTHADVSREWQIWDVDSVGGSEMEVNESAVLLH